MKTNWWITPGMLVGTVGALCLGVALCEEPSAGKPSTSQIADKDRVSVVVARDRAKLMHEIYSATLDVMHHRYFRGERAVVPARAMEEVFSEIKLQNKTEARWIAVNMTAMSIDHEPQSEFEKRAAKEIAAGKSDLEIVEDGYYRRAGAIPLTSGCISCHGAFFREPTKSSKFAGLVISVPITNEATKSN